MDSAALDWRLESFHRPYHAALAEALVEARGRFGHAILIDLHSMPPIPLGQPGHGARIVVGDRFGDSAGEWLIDRVMASARSEEQTSELQSLMRTSYAVFCLTKKR